MWLFKKPKNDKLQLYKVNITYQALVMAKNEIHAKNLTGDLQDDFYEATHKYIGKFAVHFESIKARRT